MLYRYMESEMNGVKLDITGAHQANILQKESKMLMKMQKIGGNVFSKTPLCKYTE